MRFMSTRFLHHLPEPDLLAPVHRGPIAAGGAWAPMKLLRRASSRVEAPDLSYWTAYDHFMVEREARAMRRAYVYALMTKWRAAIRKRVFG
jgi:hypothetical protein